MDRVHEFVPIFSEAAPSVAIFPVALFWCAPWYRLSHLRLGQDLGTMAFGMWPVGMYIK